MTDRHLPMDTRVKRRTFFKIFRETNIITDVAYLSHKYKKYLMRFLIQSVVNTDALVSSWCVFLFCKYMPEEILVSRGRFFSYFEYKLPRYVFGNWAISNYLQHNLMPTLKSKITLDLLWKPEFDRWLRKQQIS